MNDFLPFTLLFAFVIVQRIVELIIAKRNENWMKNQGALEFGTRHYRLMVTMHLLFLASFLYEKLYLNRELSAVWPVLLFGFLLTQILRVWVISSLGRFWNTKIIVLPNAAVVRKGPYRFIKHPNYLVVSIELILIPLLFNAYLTASFFTILNTIMLAVRIPKEEQALSNVTEYDGAFRDCPRLIPKIVK
jgi:methyltransferase